MTAPDAARDAVPPMVPNSTERTLTALGGETDRWPPRVVSAIEQAYRDGFNAGSAAAERARIVALLQTMEREIFEETGGADAGSCRVLREAIAAIERGDHARAAVPDAAGEERG